MGPPNTGKSSLLNALLGEKLAIVTHKAQTTRHRLRGIVSTDDYQMVISDTPGHLEPKYALQEAMMAALYQSLEEADLLVYVTTPFDRSSALPEVLNRPEARDRPWILVFNKIDEAGEQRLQDAVAHWEPLISPERMVPISVRHHFNLKVLQQKMVDALPEHPPYFEEDLFTDRSERFIAEEIIREQVIHAYHQEIPYATEVVITAFKDLDQQLRIHADLMMDKGSQKGIIIGKDGRALSRLGQASRESLQQFFGKPVYLDLYVKVRRHWRNNKDWLRRLGYQ